MRRSIMIILWMLLGAVAAGGSAGYFLLQANQDRIHLINEAQAAKLQADEVKQESEQLMEEANQKLALAKQTEQKSQLALQHYQQQQELLKKAKLLSKPSASVLKAWSEYVSVPLRLSLRIPSKNQAWETTNSLAVGTKSTSFNQSTDQWLSILPFNAATNLSLQQGFTAHDSVIWYIDNHLITGSRGQFSNASGTAYVLQVMDGATTTHLLWARTSPNITEQKILDTLSTLTFAS